MDFWVGRIWWVGGWVGGRAWVGGWWDQRMVGGREGGWWMGGWVGKMVGGREGGKNTYLSLPSLHVTDFYEYLSNVSLYKVQRREFVSDLFTTI